MGYKDKPSCPPVVPPKKQGGGNVIVTFPWLKKYEDSVYVYSQNVIWSTLCFISDLSIGFSVWMFLTTMALTSTIAANIANNVNNNNNNNNDNNNQDNQNTVRTI